MINNVSSMSQYSDMTSMRSMQGGRDPSQMFNKMDSDGDGSIGQAEFEQVAAKISEMTGNSISYEDALATYDSDGNGTFSASEMDSFMKASGPPPPPPPAEGMGSTEESDDTTESEETDPILSMLNQLKMTNEAPGDLFGKIDSDGDGSISKAELQTMLDDISEMTGESVSASDVIAEYDSDGDGVLGESEMDAYMKDNAPPPPPMDGSFASQGSENDTILSLLNQLNMSQPPSPEESFAQIDSNGDGGIDATELQSMMEGVSDSSDSDFSASDAIAEYDINGDGTLDQEEMDAFVQNNRPSFQAQQTVSAYANNTLDTLSQLISSQAINTANNAAVSIIA